MRCLSQMIFIIRLISMSLSALCYANSSVRNTSRISNEYQDWSGVQTSDFRLQLDLQSLERTDFVHFVNFDAPFKFKEEGTVSGKTLTVEQILIQGIIWNHINLTEAKIILKLSSFLRTVKEKSSWEKSPCSCSRYQQFQVIVL